MSQNETKRHFELRNLDQDMRDAAKNIRPVSAKDVGRLKTNAVWTLATLAGVMLTAAFALDFI